MLYPPERIEAIKQAAVLKKETDIGECADTYVMIAKNTSMTGQRIAVGMLSESRMCHSSLLTIADAGVNVAAM